MGILETIRCLGFATRNLFYLNSLSNVPFAFPLDADIAVLLLLTPQCSAREWPSARVWGVNGCVGKLLTFEVIKFIRKQEEKRWSSKVYFDRHVVGQEKKASGMGRRWTRGWA